MEVVQNNKLDRNCSSSQRRSDGVQERSFTQTNLYWRMEQSTVSRMKKINDNHLTITCASFVRLLSICMALNDWKKKLQK